MAGDREDRSGSEPGRQQPSRRQLLFGGAVAGIGAAVAIGADQVVRLAGPPGASAKTAVDAVVGGDTVPFFGAHQAGITTPVQASMARHTAGRPSTPAQRRASSPRPANHSNEAAIAPAANEERCSSARLLPTAPSSTTVSR